MPKRVSWAVKKASSWAKVECRKHRATTMTLKSSFLPDELEKRISRGFCRGIGPRNPLFMWVLGLRPKPRTRDLPKRVKRYQGNLYQWMTKSVLVMMAQEGRPRTNVTSDKQNRGPNRWSAVQRDIPESSGGTNKHYKNKVQREVLKYLRRKLLPPHLRLCN